MTELPILAPVDCPRFATCNAPVCPLCPMRHQAVHLTGEAVCYYALQSGKDGADERYKNDPVYAAVKGRLPEIVGHFPDIGRKVERASRQAMPGGNASNLRSRRAPVET